MLGREADRVLALVEFGLDPVKFIGVALRKAARDATKTRQTGESGHPPEAKRGRPARRPPITPPDSGQECFSVRSTATELLDPLQTAIYVAVGSTPSPEVQKQFAQADRRAGRKVEPIGLIIKQTEELRLADIVRGIVRGVSEQDEQKFAAIRPKSSTNPAAGRVNTFELQILQCLAILKHQFTRPAVSKPSCPYIIHKASSSILGRGSIGLVHNADEQIRSALKRWGLWANLRRRPHSCDSSLEAIQLIFDAFARRIKKGE